jgi:hypothetical protein
MLVAFIWGALTMGCLTASTFFLKYWRMSRDRFFLLFAIAFLALAVNWLILAVLQPPRESVHYVYLIRLAAFVLILVAIVDKNRSPARPGRQPGP